MARTLISKPYGKNIRYSFSLTFSQSQSFLTAAPIHILMYLCIILLRFAKESHTTTHAHTHIQFKYVPFSASHLVHFPSSQWTRSLISTLFLSLKAPRLRSGGLREILRANPELARIGEAAACVWNTVWEVHESCVRSSQEVSTYCSKSEMNWGSVPWRCTLITVSHSCMRSFNAHQDDVTKGIKLFRMCYYRKINQW